MMSAKQTRQVTNFKQMRTIYKAALVFVGIVFIFSGLVKLNDPVGTAIKLEEYFSVFSEDFTSLFKYLEPYSLIIALVLNILEIVLGVALIINFKRKLAIRITAGLIIFFSFLTFYSAYFNKVTDCGCFGDAIPLTPWQSFGKDIILLLIISLLLFVKEKSKGSKFKQKAIATLFLTGALTFLGVYAINHLPFIDFRVYKEGANIPSLMQASVPCKYKYIFEKDGDEVEFEKYVKKPGYTYKDVKVINEKECSPKITDYNLTSPLGEDFTQASLSGRKLFVVVHKMNKKVEKKLLEANIKGFASENTDYEVLILTASETKTDAFLKKNDLPLPYYLVDATVLKTMVRSNPGFLALKEGTILKKWHYNDFPETPDKIGSYFNSKY